MHPALIVLWTLVALGFCGAMWNTYGTEPACKDNVITVVVWMSWLALLCAVSLSQAIATLAKFWWSV